jgi:PadR family transcriptional regulator PadR
MDSRLLWGAAETLILEVISEGPTYGYEIAQTVTNRSHGYFELKEGSLYPALHRLEQQKLISSFWELVDGRRRKYYKLCIAGQRALNERKTEWRAFAKGMHSVLGLDAPRVSPTERGIAFG